LFEKRALMFGQTPKSSVPSRRSGAIVVPKPLRRRQKLVAILIYALVRAVSATWRCDIEDHTGLIRDKQSGPLLFGLWHNRLALSMVAWRYVKRMRPNSNLGALISASKDGGILSDVLARFGVQSVRGSTSRRGPQALLELTSWAEQGYHLAITPDGPRGPRYVVQEGIIGLAQVTGCPIIPVSSKVRGKICPNSWDRFQIPLPFASCKIVFGEPLSIPREVSNGEREHLRQDLEKRLRTMTED
jgi:lysophospholipid acyltransferase (LPLAT)-like uncharacterized protein